MKKIKHIKKLKGYKENPFFEELEKELNPVRKRKFVGADNSKAVQNLVIDDNGEVIAETRLLTVKNVDEEQFAKIYAEKTSRLWDMPKPASRVFSYILAHLKPNQGEIYVHESEIAEYCKYKSGDPIWRGIKFLLENGFIAKSLRPYFYFINPTIFFNGDRLLYAEMYVKKTKKELEEIEFKSKQKNLFD